MNQQIFKPYDQNQPMLLPPDLEELIPEEHLVRVVNEMINQLDRKILVQHYKNTTAFYALSQKESCAAPHPRYSHP
jgi:transposase